jgi:hypothetical protein
MLFSASGQVPAHPGNGKPARTVVLRAAFLFDGGLETAANRF